MPKVTVLNVSHENPLSFIGSVVGINIGYNDDSKERALCCWNDSNAYALEHVTATLRINGISLACAQPLMRNSTAYFVQESQRYKKNKTDGCGYVVPPEIACNGEVFEKYFTHMNACIDLYQSLLESGVMPGDAHYVLPEAYKTNVNMTMNIRELEKLYKTRTERSAQWEIKDLACKIKLELSKVSNEWFKVCYEIGQRAKED